MKLFFSIIINFTCLFAIAQDNMQPAPAQQKTIYIKNGNVHTGTGAVLPNTSIEIKNGKITAIGPSINSNDANAQVIDATGKEVYPGLILSNSSVGLREIGAAVRGSNDYFEIGDLNPNVKSIVAYNTDSKIINTLRSNGILLAQVVPQGNVIRGTSSVVQLDAWTWEDAAYKTSDGVHINMPSLLVRQNRNNIAEANAGEGPLTRSYEQIEFIKNFFREAKAYLATAAHAERNLKFEAVRGLFDRTENLYVHCDLVKEILVAVDFAKEFNFKVVIIGGSESFLIAPLLKENNLSVILGQVHELPTTDDDDVDQPYKTPAALQAAGVLFCITDIFSNTLGRNLSYNAGTAAAYGLTKEQALQAITLNAAKILGIDNRTGSLEIGKDANIIISSGDILDMQSSTVTHALIQGRNINLDDKHKQLARKYTEKYNSKTE